MNNRPKNKKQEKTTTIFKAQHASSSKTPLSEIFSEPTQRRALLVGIAFVFLVGVGGYNIGKDAAVKGDSTTNQKKLLVTPTPDPTKDWVLYYSTCGFSAKVPPFWNVQKFFVVDSPEACGYFTAPDYVQNFDSRSGFFITIQKTEAGTQLNGVVINTLNDYILANERSLGIEVAKKQEKRIGSLQGILYDPVGYEQLTAFVFAYNNTLYNISWPHENVYSGEYKEFIHQIISSLRFNN